MRDLDRSHEPDPIRPEKRPYRSPVLTEYGSLDELVHAEVGGIVPSIVIE
jgi:hypothetical protein